MALTARRTAAAAVPFSLALTLLACAPSAEAPVQVMALVRTGGSGGSYQPTQVALRTVSDPVTLQGSVANLIGGARIDVDPNDPLLRLNGGALSEDQLARVFVKDSGRAPRVSYVQKDGVLWPADFHSWNLVTTYFNFEHAFDHFQQLGVPGARLAEVRVFYFPEFILRELSGQPLRDNALFFSPVKSFMILPFDELQRTPLSINQGIVTHEYAHVVWNRLVFNDAALPETLTRWSGNAAVNVNILKSLDEGFADFHAYAASCRTPFGCDTRFMEASFDESLTNQRDMARTDLCVSEGLRNSIATLGVNEFTGLGLHYQLGTVLAASLYHAGSGPEDWQSLSRAVVESYGNAQGGGLSGLLRENIETPQNFTLERVLQLLLDSVTSPELKTRLCGQFLGRLGVARENLGVSCPGAAVPAQGCAR